VTAGLAVDNRVFENGEALAHATAEWLCAKAIASKSRFSVCCSGGSTPRRLYELLAQPEIAMRFPWDRVHWFWGDERFVPHDHPDSNYRMTWMALLSQVPVHEKNIHPVPTEKLSPEEAANAYDKDLKTFYGAGELDPARPLFDVMLLGIGDDGHTASLFPGHPVLDEKRRWVTAVLGAKSEARITLTYPALDSSRDAVFLAVGDEKRSVVQRAMAGDSALPAARIDPVGQLHWFTDRAATPAKAASG
jgi:6-phosphogluconolactonase